MLLTKAGKYRVLILLLELTASTIIFHNFYYCLPLLSLSKLYGLETLILCKGGGLILPFSPKQSSYWGEKQPQKLLKFGFVSLSGSFPSFKNPLESPCLKKKKRHNGREICLVPKSPSLQNQVTLKSRNQTS